MQYFRYRAYENISYPAVEQIKEIPYENAGLFHSVCIILLTLLVSECLCLFLIHSISQLTWNTFDDFPSLFSILTTDNDMVRNENENDLGGLDEHYHENGKQRKIVGFDQLAVDKALITRQWTNTKNYDGRLLPGTRTCTRTSDGKHNMNNDANLNPQHEDTLERIQCAICLNDFGECCMSIKSVHQVLYVPPISIFLLTIQNDAKLGFIFNIQYSICNVKNHSLVLPKLCVEENDSVSKSKFCEHEFHTSCYKEWLTGSHTSTCPYCRRDIFKRRKSKPKSITRLARTTSSTSSVPRPDRTNTSRE